AAGFREIGRMGEHIFTSMAIGMLGGKLFSVVIGRVFRLSAGSEGPPPGKLPPTTGEKPPPGKAPAAEPGRAPAPEEAAGPAPGRAPTGPRMAEAEAEAEAATLAGLFRKGLTDDGAAEAYLFQLSRRLSRQAQIELQGFLRAFGRPSEGLKVL